MSKKYPYNSCWKHGGGPNGIAALCGFVAGGDDGISTSFNADSVTVLTDINTNGMFILNSVFIFIYFLYFCLIINRWYS